MISFNVLWVASRGVTIFTKLTTAVNTQYRLIPLTHWIHSKTEATEHEFNIHDARSCRDENGSSFATHDPRRPIS